MRLIDLESEQTRWALAVTALVLFFASNVYIWNWINSEGGKGAAKIEPTSAADTKAFTTRLTPEAYEF